MKYTIILLTCIIFNWGYSQNESFKVNYTVDYLIPKKNGQKDSLSISFNKDGKYLITESKSLAESITKQLMGSLMQNENNLNTSTHIILNTSTGEIYINVNMSNNRMFFKIDITQFMPKNNNSTNFGEGFKLITEKTDSSLNIFDKEIPFYDIYPKNEKDDRINVAIDSDYEVNNNQVFKRFFELVLKSMNASSTFEVDLPQGLILSVKQDNKTLIEAYNIDDTEKTIDINYSFKISE